MLKDYKVGLVSAETRISEIEYINRNSKYSYAQKEELLGIIDKIEKTIDKISELNDIKMSDTDREEKLKNYTEELAEAEFLYQSLQNKYEGKNINLEVGTGRSR